MISSATIRKEGMEVSGALNREIESIWVFS